MNWISTNSPNSILKEYQLMDGAECKVVLKHNSGQNSIRIICGKNQRLFFIESTGQLSLKLLLKNEYGMETGTISQDPKSGKNSGTILLDLKKYSFEITGNGQGTILNMMSKQQLATCELINSNSDYISNFLLLGLVWFLTLPIEKKIISGFAA